MIKMKDRCDEAKKLMGSRGYTAYDHKWDFSVLRLGKDHKIDAVVTLSKESPLYDAVELSFSYGLLKVSTRMSLDNKDFAHYEEALLRARYLLE
jgi:hypothetical protein